MRITGFRIFFMASLAFACSSPNPVNLDTAGTETISDNRPGDRIRVADGIHESIEESVEESVEEAVEDICRNLCATDDECKLLEDDDVCNGTLFCDTGLSPAVCMVDPETVIDVDEGDCDDDIDCTADSCDSETGCVHLAVDAGCDDGNVCTLDLCNPDSGCVSTALEGPCGDNAVCTNGQCVCEFLACGDTCCSDGHVCVDDVCCLPDCAGKQCGPDGCNGSCGTCSELQVCAAGGQCACEFVECNEACCETGHVCFDGTCCPPDCAGKICGSDGCGGTCGTCGGPQDICQDGECVCIPDCLDKECGPDGCGGECGQCPDLPWITCLATGECGDVCLKTCEGKECGDIPECGLSCGECPEGAVCNKYHKCVGQSPGGCLFGECGPNGLGGGCGSCDDGLFCTNGICTEASFCQPDCDGKQCGPDGCGGSCGECSFATLCTGSGLCGGPCTQCPGPAECFDMDFSGGALTGWSNLENTSVVSSYGVTGAATGGKMLKTGPDGKADYQFCTGPGQYVLSIVWQAYWKGYRYSGNGRDVYVRLALDSQFNDWKPGPLNSIFLASGKDLAPKVWCGLDSPSCDGFDTWEACDSYKHCHWEWEQWPDCETSICYNFNTWENGWCPSYYACDPWEGGGWGDDCQWCGEHYFGLEDQKWLDYGFHTPWVETISDYDEDTILSWYPLSVTAHGKETVLLIDRIRLIKKDEFCNGRECGGQEVGLDCGACPEGEVCGVDGMCQPGCQPDCDGKECGWDGCGDWCGLCEGNDKCYNGQCQFPCEPQCDGKQCGSNGCKISGDIFGSCGTCESCGEYCSDDGQCIADPCGEMECGENCGVDCGQCPNDEVCRLGFCCNPDCTDKACGPDGCGGWCGFCPPGGACISGECLTMSCGDKECGDNGFGGWCGECDDGMKCVNGLCIKYMNPNSSCGGEYCGEDKFCIDNKCCIPDCDNKNCGDDGCDHLCGLCDCGEICTDGVCVFTACDGKECGNDQCGDLCGQCPDGQSCHQGQCCTPDCAGKECGDDGCGGNCAEKTGAGECSDGDPATWDLCQDHTCAHPPVYCNQDAQCPDADNTCTADSCEDGLCIHTPQDKPGCCKEEIVLWDFEDGIPDNLEIENSHPEVGWRLGTESITHVDYCLLYGEPLVLYNGDNSGKIVFPPVLVPTLEKKPKLLLDVKSYLSATKVIILHHNGGNTQISDKIVGGYGFTWGTMELDLSDYSGEWIRLELNVDGNKVYQKYKLLIDNIRITQDCCDEDTECDDGNLCTLDYCNGPSGFCHNDFIEGCCLDDGGCDDEDDCTWDFCLPDHTCKHLTLCCQGDEQCTDADDLCTADFCIDNQCQYIPTFADGCCVKPIFFDDFSTDQGWEYGQYWERGEAMASDCAAVFNEDPGVDHTGSDDNSLAGVLIGGCLQWGELYPLSYLTSPILEVEDQEELFLVYWRWLNTNEQPKMSNVVDVYDGTSWINIWESGEKEIYGGKWTPMSHDISQYINPQLRVRFGFEIGKLYPIHLASWNIDDVRITNTLDEAQCCLYNSDCEIDDKNCILGKCQ